MAEMLAQRDFGASSPFPGPSARRGVGAAPYGAPRTRAWGIPQWESQHVPMGRDDARRPPALRAQRIERRQAWRPATPLALWRRAPHARAGQGTAPHALGKGAASASSAHLIRFVLNTSDQNDTWGAVGLCSLISIDQYQQSSYLPTSHR